ncbi:MAG: SpvB/TcaC N-terminal domain-containing protein [Ferruginibacter sp.]
MVNQSLQNERKNEGINKSRHNAGSVNNAQKNSAETKSNQIEIPQISLPKGGGALKSIDEKFSVNAVNGSATFSIPLPITPARNGFYPALGLSYSSGVGNSLFGLGWDVDFPAIQRKTDKQLPHYFDDDHEEDIFMFSGVEDLVPFLDKDNNWAPLPKNNPPGYDVRQYLPRIEGSFARIEKITPVGINTFYWKVTTKENVVTFFGRSDSHRITDPSEASRIFKWLPEFSFDDKGNCMFFEFKDENLDEVKNLIHEANRFDGLAKFTNKHLKRVRYGNHLPFYPGYVDDPTKVDEIYNTQIPPSQEYFFDVVFDFGEHTSNLTTEDKVWNARTDAFSDYRAGFEIRTYRLCERVLIFHNFDEMLTAYGSKTCLVKSLDLTYQDKASLSDQQLEVTYLKSITQTGHTRKSDGSYLSRSLPPMEFTYNELSWNKEIKTISTENIINAPAGLSSGYQWVDLYNEGISGILTEQADAWFYKSNMGNGEFTVADKVAPKPSFLGIANGSLQLQDIEATGKKHAVLNTPDLKGYFELSEDNEWQQFQAFEQIPTQDFRDPNAKFIDLNGDGMPDLVVSEENVFTWYPAKGIKGYDAARITAKPFDEQKGPAIVFADITQSIFLTDMSGDGLTDIVRLRNGEICYWPNLGYGRFGPKVNMSKAPVFDVPDQFNPFYLHLADISGTGATDVLYLGKNKFKAWLNLGGNAWSPPCEIDPFPGTEDPNQLAVVDLLGNGTACIVWSSPLPGNTNAPMRYIDLMGGRKPHIMAKHVNNFGKETTLEYKSSSHFYLEDKKKGRPWITRLPFPVHCVSRLEVVDTVADLRFTNKYVYHHGYYDHAEREFRGFGMVEQTDTEEYEYLKNLHAANATAIRFHEFPVLTKTWFHTGAYLRNKKILDHFKEEYWFKNELVKDDLAKAGILNSDKMEWQLPDAQFIGNFSVPELVEAHRACKGMILRQEIFALDGSDKEAIPYSVATHNCHIKLLQPKNENRFAVFLVHECEAITFSYERNIQDPRIAHTLNLEIDEFGNVLKSAAIVYARADNAISATVNATDISLHDHLEFFKGAQGKEHIIYTVTEVTKDVGEKNNGRQLFYYRLPVPWLVKTYESVNIKKSQDFYELSDFTNLITGTGVTPIAYHETSSPGTGIIQLRLIEQVETFLLGYDLRQPLDPGKHGALGITYESYQLAYTPELIDLLYNTDDSGNAVVSKRVTDLVLVTGKFCHLGAADKNWWIRSGTMQYFDSTAGETRSDTAKRFYLPVSYTDPFGSITSVSYYSDYYLQLKQTKDALDNAISVEAFDFRTLSPKKIKDHNANLTEVAIDTLGLVVGTAIMGKGAEADDLAGFNTDLSTPKIQDFFADPFKNDNGRDLLQHATTRMVYDFTSIPCSVGTIAREEHHAVNPNPKLQFSFEYSGGLGNVVLKKIQAEPGYAPYRDAAGKLVEKAPGELDLQQTTHRWVGNGRTILNNKGKPVKQYEPYFSDSHLYEDEPELREAGVTPILHYDAAGRLVKTIMPDDTFSSIEYDSWMHKSFDQNDNCTKSKWYTDRITGAINAVLTKQGKDPAKEKEAANKTFIHDNTFSAFYTDSLGRPFCTIAHNKFDDFAGSAIEEFHATRTMLDIEGNIRAVIDARDNTVMEYKYDMLGHQSYQKSMDAGERWLLNDSMGKPTLAWDSKDQQFETTYDMLHRPVEVTVTRLASGTAILFEKFEYIDTKGLSASQLAAQQAGNLVGTIVTHYDTAGIVKLARNDFKGNPLESSRQLCHDYTKIPDWKTSSLVSMENEVFITKSEFDALNRPVKIFTPHTAEAPIIPASVITPGYNEANFLNTVNANLRGSTTATPFVRNIDYDAKGQRMSILYGNNTATKYFYDTKTFRLLRLVTTRNAGADKLQDFSYTYDPVGNITFIKDDAQQSLFFNNRLVEPGSDYVYDSIYRLIQATGREHIASNAPDAYDAQRTNLAHKGDGNQLQQYTQRYKYDEAGNMLLMQNLNSWSRAFTYSPTNNQLLTSPANNEVGTPFLYPYDAHGNTIKMPHLPLMEWNFKDELQHIGITASAENDAALGSYYVYDAGGQRIRKVVEKNNITEERIYLGGFEIFRKRRNGTRDLERETLHIVDGTRRIALIDTKLKTDHSVEAPLIRYQYSNHLGSASLELDGSSDALIISYEEYHPYGSTSYQGTDHLSEVPKKRYRFTGKERDEESGLEYHGARYYAPWLGRWTTIDPIGIRDGLNGYIYVKGHPISMIDKTGTTCNSVTNCADDQSRSIEDIEQSNSVIGHEMDKSNYESAVVQKDREENKLTIPKVDIDDFEKKAVAAIKQTETKQFKVAKALAEAESARQVQFKQEAKKEAETEKDLPGFVGSVAPLYGSGKSSYVYFSHGSYGRGVIYGALAISDVFLVKSIAVGGGRLALKASAALIGAEKAVPTAVAAGIKGAEAARIPAIIDSDVLMNAYKGNANAMEALSKVDPHVTHSQLREFLDVNTEVQEAQLAQFLLDEGVKPLSTSYGQLTTPQLSDTFWNIARIKGTGDASLVIHGMQSGLPIVTGDAALIRTLHQPLKISGVHFFLVYF